MHTFLFMFLCLAQCHRLISASVLPSAPIDLGFGNLSVARIIIPSDFSVGFNMQVREKLSERAFLMNVLDTMVRVSKKTWAVALPDGILVNSRGYTSVQVRIVSTNSLLDARHVLWGLYQTLGTAAYRTPVPYSRMTSTLYWQRVEVGKIFIEPRGAASLGTLDPMAATESIPLSTNATGSDDYYQTDNSTSSSLEIPSNTDFAVQLAAISSHSLTPIQLVWPASGLLIIGASYDKDDTWDDMISGAYDVGKPGEQSTAMVALRQDLPTPPFPRYYTYGGIANALLIGGKGFLDQGRDKETMILLKDRGANFASIQFRTGGEFQPIPIPPVLA